MAVNVRAATYQDVMPIADILHRSALGKTDPHICRNRANTMVKRSRLKRVPAYALVADDGEALRGFLFAQEREAFDLTPRIKIMEVPFLVGRNAGRALVRELRNLTKKRILIMSWKPLGREPEMSRFLESEGFQPIGTAYHS